jgi:tRNA nucleotidyltransferase/poly(A) polymerase
MPGAREIDTARLPELVETLPGIETIRKIAERLPAYLVGGAVRDR